MSDPRSAEEWITVARRHEATASILISQKGPAQQAYFHILMAVECALKALIWHKQRFNQPPSKEKMPGWYSHNIQVLLEISGMNLGKKDPVAPSAHALMSADRNVYYCAKPMSQTVPRSLFEAAFGMSGLVTEIRRQMGI